MPVQRLCERCSYCSSMSICKACLLIEGLNKGIPKLGIGKTERYRKEIEKQDDQFCSRKFLSKKKRKDNFIYFCLDDQSSCHCMKEKLTLNEHN